MKVVSLLPLLVPLVLLLLLLVPKSSTATPLRTLGTALSSFVLGRDEMEIFNYNITSTADLGTITHFWTTGSSDVIDFAWVRYYIDGERTASVAFQPSYACGVGFGDSTAGVPWGTKWFGKGAKLGGWFTNVRVPFGKSVRVTMALPSWAPEAIAAWVIVRGVEGMPIVLEGVQLPAEARMQLIKTNATVKPLDWVNFVDLPSGQGLIFLTSLFVRSGNLNFLEGCFHLYTPPATQFPGLLLSSGCEDMYDSAFYFDAGGYHMPVSGFTHYANANGTVTLSAYRVQDMDPLAFSDGVRLVWRNGDMVDPKTGVKCATESGGRVVGHPTASEVATYSWVYVW